LLENGNGLIMGAQVFQANGTAELNAARLMLTLSRTTGQQFD
jgi:hypothetical protein